MADTAGTRTSPTRTGVAKSTERLRLPTAKWGAACSACATAKAKCIRSNQDPGSKCDRCQRLFKDCAAQVHRPRKKRQVKPSRTAQIEERLDGLMSLLQASGDLSKTDVDREKLGDLLGAKVSTSASKKRSPPLQPNDLRDNPWAVPDSYNADAPQSCICRPESGDAPPPPDSDEALLNIYRNDLLPAHPFVVIPPTMSAAKLKETRPFLMSAIRMVASFRSLRSMRAQMYHLMKHISEQMLIRSERSLDLLLGIIVIIGWYQYHCFMHAQLSNLISLAQTLVGELGLGMPPNRSHRTILMVLKPFDVQPRSNEEKRALAGVWFLSSSLSLSFGKIESIKYTRYLHQCLKDLEASMEYETDTTLVYLVRIQYLIDRIAQCSSPENNLDDMPVVPALPAPRDVYVSSLQAELDQIRHDLPPRLKLDKIFQTYINTAALRLHAPPCIDSELITSLAEALTSSFDRPSSTLDEIYRSHSVLVAWFDNWLSVPVSSYYCQTTATCTLLVYAISMLGRWAKLITPSKLHKDRAGIPEDCLTGDGNCITTPASTETPSVSSTATSAPTPAASDSSQDKEPCGYNHHNPQVRSDPGLPVAVASLQLPLRQQPGLDIDIPAILSTCQARFQQVSSSIQKSSSSEAESGDHNVWSMSAIKILITRAKLERWADLVAAGTEALSLEDCATQDAIMGDVGGNPLQDGFLDGFGEINPGMGMPDFGDGMGPVWMMDLMPATEPTAFFDGYIDWSTVVMNSMGSVDQ